MNKFVILMSDVSSQMKSMNDEERQSHMQKWFSWNEKLKQAGNFVSMNPLGFDATSLVGADAKQKSRTLADSSELQFGCFYVVTAESLEEAVKLAKETPSLELGGSVEVREIMEM